jgi:hypothetical protein
MDNEPADGLLYIEGSLLYLAARWGSQTRPICRRHSRKQRDGRAVLPYCPAADPKDSEGRRVPAFPHWTEGRLVPPPQRGEIRLSEACQRFESTTREISTGQKAVSRAKTKLFTTKRITYPPCETLQHTWHLHPHVALLHRPCPPETHSITSPLEFCDVSGSS